MFSIIFEIKSIIFVLIEYFVLMHLLFIFIILKFHVNIILKYDIINLEINGLYWKF